MTRIKAIQRQRQRRRFRVRNKLKRCSTRPRLSVFRSHKHISAQLIDDSAAGGQGRTLVAASTLEREIRAEVGYGGNCRAAAVVGRVIAQRALAAGVRKAVFDRREYKYHGRIAALADAARDAGLDLGPKAPRDEPQDSPAKKKPAAGQKGPSTKAAKPKSPQKSPPASDKPKDTPQSPQSKPAESEG